MSVLQQGLEDALVESSPDRMLKGYDDGVRLSNWLSDAVQSCKSAFCAKIFRQSPLLGT